MKLKNILFTSSAICCLFLPAIAEVDSDILKITVTGTRTKRNVDDIPASITIIDLENSRQNGTSELKELIRYEPNISVYDPREINYRSSGNTRGSTSSGNLNIRGLNKNRVLMQRDGIRLPSGFYAVGYDYSNGNVINYCSLSTVDILKGPASVLYGSDALGGVISFNSIEAEDLLKNNESFKIEIPFDFNGSNQGIKSSFRIVGKSEEIGLSIAANLCTNQSKEVKPNSAEDKYINDADIKSDSIYLNVGKRLNEKNKIRFLIDKFKKNKKGKRAEGNLAGNYLSQKSAVETKKDRYAFKWDYESLDKDPLLKSLKAKTYYQNLHTSDLWLEQYSKGISYPKVSDYHLYDEMYGFEFQFGSLFENHLFTYGIDYSLTKNQYFQDKYEIINGLNNPYVDNTKYPIKRSPDSETIRLGLYLQDEVSYGDYDFIGGIRFDNYKLNPLPDPTYLEYCDEEGGGKNCKVEDLDIPNWSPKIGITRELNNNLEIWGQYSMGFKAPTWWQLQSTHRNCSVSPKYQSIPNSDLKSERSNSYEIGLRGDYERYKFQLVGFYNTYIDFIEGGEIKDYERKKSGDAKLICNIDNKNNDELVLEGESQENQETYLVDPEKQQTSTNSNVGGARIWGVEFTNKYKFTPNKNGFTLKASAGFTHGQDKIKNEPLNDIEPFKIVTGIEFISSNNKFISEFISTYSGRTRRKKDSKGYWPKPYLIFDLLGKYKYSDRLDISFGIYNLFNKTYYIDSNISSGQSIIGIEQFAEPGRHLRLGFKFAF